ncbi:predicted protein [Lichtheimia corymbifera JMRC:FSU:9682]|uniref:Uncharacterized protein n=1 Tax=Lichtheimia corymbifera JMRC:FSU:9682 TaxID=1263082 RepID=A0A068S4H0_9FUNG|nr:predicted protein [Lichtheimia corymbifera JMRC:FSU:9682]
MGISIDAQHRRIQESAGTVTFLGCGRLLLFYILMAYLVPSLRVMIACSEVPLQRATCLLVSWSLQDQL